LIGKQSGAGGSHRGTGQQNLSAEKGTQQRRQWKRESPVVAPESSLADYFFAPMENMSDPALDEEEKVAEG
ncbi:hypothetical protein, partial [Streptomyces fildesensis]|uniref:hypothetical protein n=1 Tax=Streptomyces fildesensis TaxID=375757 RepID=UPI001E650644